VRIIPALLATAVAAAPAAAKDFKAPNNPKVEGGIIRSDVDDRGATIIAWAFNLSDKAVSVQLSCVAFDAKDRPLTERTVFIFRVPSQDKGYREARLDTRERPDYADCRMVRADDD
jgi:hypothetical protein